MKNKLAIVAWIAAVLLSSLWLVGACASEMDKLIKMSDQLDQMEKQDFDMAISQANACIRSRNFSCAEAQLAKAAKSANGSGNRNTLEASRQDMAAEKAAVQAEAKRRAEEAERQAKARREEVTRLAQEEQLRRTQPAQDEQAREEEMQQQYDACSNRCSDQQRSCTSDSTLASGIGMLIGALGKSTDAVNGAGNAGQGDIAACQAQGDACEISCKERFTHDQQAIAEAKREAARRQAQNQELINSQAQFQNAMANARAGADQSAATAGSVATSANGGAGEPVASQLEGICRGQCSQETSDCKTFGAQAACFRASACVKRCFAQNAPNHPNSAEWLRSAAEDEKAAANLSGAPYTFNFGKNPPKTIYQPPSSPLPPNGPCGGPGLPDCLSRGAR